MTTKKLTKIDPWGQIVEVEGHRPNDSINPGPANDFQGERFGQPITQPTPSA